MTIGQALAKNTIKLVKNKIPDPRLDAEILLSHILDKPREFLLTYPEKTLSKTQAQRLNYAIKRRLNGEPVAYILGHKNFFGFDFIVNKNTLVPRPETELMVEEAIQETPNIKHVTFIDVGTGSGCIIISLAKILQKKLAAKKKLSSGYPELSFCRKSNFYGIDISRKALNVAKKNAKKNAVDKRIKFIQGDLLEPILKSKIINLRSKIIILANLPYLTTKQVKNSPTIQSEPKLALIAGNDGLKYYRELFKQIKKLQVASCKLQVILEIDPTQTTKIKKLAKSELPSCKIKIKKDLAGYNRFVTFNLDKK